MKIIFALLVLFTLMAIFAAVQSKNKKGTDRTGAYRKREFMTENESEFFGRLVVALPEHYIFPQVAMSALLETASNDKKKALSDRLRIAQQRVDYVVCTKSCEVVAVVELDDKTHSRAKDEIRDERLEQAGIRTVRFQARNKPKVDAIRTLILGPATINVKTVPNETAQQHAATVNDAPVML